MKFLKSISVLTLLLCMALFVVSCGGSANDHADHSADEAHSHEAEADHDHDEAHSHEAAADHDHDGATTAGVHGEGVAYTSAYVCPMHCDNSGSAEAGKCPTCGMSYVAQADHVKDGHKHE